jgi:hypothetical protein
MILEELLTKETLSATMNYQFDFSTYKSKFMDVFLKENPTEKEILNNIKHVSVEEI